MHKYMHTYIQMASRLIHLRSETVNERAKDRYLAEVFPINREGRFRFRVRVGEGEGPCCGE